MVTDVIDRPEYSGIVASVVRSAPYTQLWKSFISEGLYDVRLIDESFFQFVEHPSESFSYFDSPVDALTFEEFYADQLGGVVEDDTDGELVAMARRDYEEYLGALDFKRPATPIRYDYSPPQYRCSCHPVAHLHFGFSSEIRVATKRRWSPESFAMFVIRQYFPKFWDAVLAANSPSAVQATLRGNLGLVDAAYWGPQHEAESYLY